MTFNIKTFILIATTTLLSITFISSCSLEDADIVRAPGPEDIVLKRNREAREAAGDREEDSFVGNMFNDLTLFGKKDTVRGGGIGVNTFLWKATLDTLAFMPLLSADPFGGVIITDWHSNSETSKEKF